MHSKHFVMLCLLTVWASVSLMAQVPKAGFKVDGTAMTVGQTIQVCIGNSLQFTSTATNANDFNWTFDGGAPSSSTNANPYVTYNSPGTFKAVQTVAFVAGGLQDSLWIFIQVNNSFPKASFGYTPKTLVCGSTNYQFTSNSTGTGLAYKWDFGDAVSSALQNPPHSFTKATGSSGSVIYNVKLTVTNSSNCADDTIVPVEVLKIPDAKISSSDPTIQVGTFNGENTFKKCNNIPSYIFPFLNQSTTRGSNTGYTIKWGDGSPDTTFAVWTTGVIINHLFKLGNTIMTLTVKGPGGCESVKQFSIFLGSNPAAGFASLGNTQICAPDSQRFVISGVGSNAPGTSYTLSVNDQSAAVTQLHPPQDTVTHWFLSSSCGISSNNGTQTFSNSFRATLKAENPCGSTSLSVLPIYVSGKPNPKIGIPTPNVCVNTNIALTNTGNYGGVITINGSGNAVCANTGKQVWKITPATGFTIVTGSLGNLNGSLDGNVWTDGAQGLDVRFTTTGTYKVKLYLFNNKCGMDSSVEETICVRLPPTASFTLDKKTFCGPGTVKATNTSPVGACGGDLYNWAIRYDDAQGCSGINGASFINGTNNTTTNAEINFATPGRYIIDLTVVAKGGTCPTPVFSDTVFVKAKPAVTIDPIAAICGGTSLTPTATASGCYGTATLTYAWAFTNGTPSTSNSLVPGGIAYALAGSHPVSLTVGNECGTTKITTSALINAKPVITNIANKPICSGVDVQLPLASSVAGTQFSWTSTLISGVASGFTSSGGFVTATSINDILENTGATAAVVEYRITAQGPAPSLCLSNEMVVQITVSSGVEASNAGIDQYLCNLTTTQLDANSPAIGTGKWKQISGPAATIANTGNAKTNVTGLVGNNVYVFEWTITGSTGTCAVSTDAVSIYNRPTLTLPNAGKDTAFCGASATSIHLNGNTLRPFETGTWRIISNTTDSIPVFADINNPATLASNLDLGKLTFGWLVSNDAGCTPIEDQIVVSVDDGPETAMAGKDQLICAATQATMSAVSPVFGSGKWTQVSGPSAVITTPGSATSTITNLTPGSTYVFRWTVTAANATCGSTFDDMTVEVRPPLTLPNAGTDSSFCGGGLSTYNLDGNTLRPFETGTWSVIYTSAGTPQLSDPNNPKAILSDLLVGTVRVEWRVTNDLNCGSMPDTVELLIGDGPVPAKAGVDQFLCATNQISLSGNIPAAGTGLWVETSGLGAVITSPLSASTLVTGIVPGNNYTFRWTVTAPNPACGSNGDDAVMVVRLPVSQADAGKDANLCAAGGSAYILQGNTPQAFETGTWQIISFTTAGLPAISDANDAGATLSNLSTGSVRLQWSITNDLNCKPTLDTVTITVGSGSIQSDAGSDQKLCNVTQAFLGANVPSSGTGLWTQDNGPTANIVNTGNSSTLIDNLVPGNYTFRWTVTAANPLCGSSFDQMDIIVRPAITKPDAGADKSICDGGGTYTLEGNTPLSFETGTWKIISFTTTGLPAISNANDPAAVLSNLSVGNVRLQWSITNDVGCVAVADTVSITIGSGSLQADAGTDQKLCNVNQAFLSGNVPSDGTGLWTQESGASVAIATPDDAFSSITGLVPGTYVFRWTVASSIPSCGSAFDLVTVIVRPIITSPNAGKDESICDAAGNSFVLQGNTPRSFETGTWKIISFTTAGLPAISSINDPNAVLSNISLGNVRLQWSITNDVGCAPLADTVTINIGAGSIQADAGPDQKLCDVTQTLLSGNIPPSGTGLWTQESGAVASIADAANSSTIVAGLKPGTYVFRWTVTAQVATCGSSFDLVTIVVRPQNTIPNAGSDSSFCAASASAYTLQGNTLRLFETGTWQVISYTTANKPLLSDVNNPKALLSGLSVGNVRLQWSVTNDAACTKVSDTVSLNISDGPLAADAGSDQAICNTTQAFLSGSLPSSGSGLWKKVSGPAAIIADATNATTTVTGLVPGKYVFRWTVTAANAACGSTTDDVEISVRPSVTQPNAGKDSSICSAGNLTYILQGNTYGAFETGTWKIISFTTAGRPVISDVNSPTAELSNLSAGNVRLEWVMTNDVGCSPIADTVNISIGIGPVKADAGTDQIICAATQVSLSGNTPSSGTGAWLQNSGSTTAIADSSDASTVVRGLVPGNVYTFRWTTTAALAVCGSSSDEVKITVRPPITIPNAGRDSVVCAATVPSYTLQGNTVRSFETGTWKIISYTTSKKPLISDILKPKAILSNIAVGKVRLEWRVTNDLGCVQLADTVDLTFADGPQQAIAGEDQQLCSAPSTQLAATIAKNGFLGSWEVIAPTTQILVDKQYAATIISGLPIGQTLLVWTVANNICPAGYDTVIVNVFPPLVNNIAGNQTICNGQQAILIGDVATGGNGAYKYQWQTSTNNDLFTDLQDDTLVTLQQSPSANTWYRRSVISGPCSSFSDTVVVTVQPPITNNKISASQQVCVGNAAKNMNGTVPAGGDGNFNFTWQQSIDSGKTWKTIATAKQEDFAPGIITQTTFYRRLVNSSFCTGAQADTSVPVSVTINPNAIALFAPTKQKDCAPFLLNGEIVNLTTYPTNNSSYRWYVNDSLIGTGNNFPGYKMQQPGDSIILKMVAVSRYGCKNDSLAFPFTTLPQPKPAFTLSDSVGCGPLTIQFTNTTPDTAQFTFAWDFGNGKTSNLAQPSPIFFDINPNYGDTVYAVKMSAFNECDTVVVTHFVRVRAKAKALIALDKTTGCSPMEVTLFNVSRGSQASYKWDFGDSTPELITNDATVKHIYNTDVLDTFYVKLYSSNDCGNDTQQYAIVVNPGLIAINVNINGNQINGCLPHTVMFVNNTKGANLFNWDFGDGSAQLATTKGVDTVVHTYNITGTFAIKLFATNSCTDTIATEIVTVQEKPGASFTPLPAIACVGQEIKMTNTSTPNITYNWSFGDGSNSNLFEPAKKYTSPGSYRILLIASRAFPQGLSCIDSAFHTIVINDSLPGSFAVNGLENCAPFAVTFINNDKPATSTIWDFGDGETGSGDSLVHTYTIPGQYFVKMVSKSIEGCVLTASQTITVTGPVGVINYKSGSACLGETLNFTAVANNANSYRFYFGNGDSVTSNIPNVVYTYARAGNYLPSVLLIGGNCTKLVYGIDSIQVDKISAGFTYTSGQTCGATTYQFTDTSNANSGVVLRNWDFGDGTTATTTNPEKKYTTTGLYNVHLKATSNNGCIDTLTVPLAVQVWDIPKAIIESDSLACIADMVSFTANVQSADPVTGNSWDFGNGLQGIGATASSNYSQGGLYTIKLVSTTNLGCADTATKTIRISVAPLINAGNNVRICLGQSTNLNATGGTVYQWTPTIGLSCSNCANPIAKPIITTQYIVTGRNQFSCPKNDTVEVEVIQPFSISTSGNDTLCLGDSRQISATGAFSYIWTPITGLNSATIQNPLATPDITTTYKVIGYDNYNCFTDTSYLNMAVGQVPTVDAGIGGTVPAGTEVRLQPRVNNGPFDRYTWTPQIDLNCYNCLSPIATVNSNITYRLEVENNYNCVASDTISFRVICNKDAQLFIPNAFSPDGDGINDILMVRGKGIAQVKIFRVFNRYGQIVYEKANFSANDPQFGWDGKIRGVPAANEVYIVTAEALCGGGELFKYQGNVTLFR